MEPLFSIITVTWNAAGVLPATLRSVRQQTCTDYELLLMDGASTDDTLAVARQADIASMRVFSEPDRGLYDAMNKGIDRARGKYLIFLNAGDAFASDTVLARLAVLANDNPDVMYGQTQLVDARGNVVGMRHLTAPRKLTARSFTQGMLVCHQAFVARRTLAPQYDLRYRYSADYDWCINVLDVASACAYAGDEPLVSYLNEGGTTNRHHLASLWERYRIMCHHYGTGEATRQHISFIPRYFKRRWLKKS